VSLTLENIHTVIVKVLKEVQELSGRDWSDLSPASKPLFSLGGFDSLCSIEATAILEERLGFRLEKAPSIFFSEDGKEALTLLETSRLIQKHLKGMEVEQ
jgi:hypothetical protein